jgi:ornithine cyclodeaminase/alanine dehydrogenase-like protein (mu-crystallin family)
MLALTREDVRRLVPMPDAIELMKTAFSELSAGRTVSPLRTLIPVEAHNGDALFMPAHVPGMDALGLRSSPCSRTTRPRGCRSSMPSSASSIRKRGSRSRSWTAPT